MRILHVLDRSLPTVGGYTSRSAALVEHQAALGLSPCVLTGPREPGSETEIIHGVRHHRTFDPDVAGFLHGVPVARETVEMIALGRRLRALHREEPFDLVHAHSPVLCGVPAHVVARRLGLPSVYEIRAFWEDAAEQRGQGRRGSARYTATRTLETALCARADAVVTICEGLRRDLLARGIPASRLFLVPNGVDVERFTPAPRDPDLEARLGLSGKTVIAYVGSLFRFEGVPLLLRALGRLDRDDVRGLILGHGEAEEEVRDSIARLGLGGRVTYLGKAPPAEVARYYTLCDVLCYPRLRHRITELTTPLKPLEAMAMGKAVVASDVGGLRELVDDERTGLLFRAEDLDSLVASLRRVADVAELRRRLGAEARAHVVAERSWRTIAARYHEVYAAACARRPQAAHAA
jgi:PEP-CTERM/exosortase A-associated glycosyltransferase